MGWDGMGWDGRRGSGGSAGMDERQGGRAAGAMSDGLEIDAFARPRQLSAAVLVPTPCIPGVPHNPYKACDIHCHYRPLQTVPQKDTN
jgi:hypothetical protein